MKIVKIVPIILALLVSSVAFSQKNFTEIADASFEHHKYHGAIEEYKKAYSKEKKGLRESKNSFSDWGVLP